MSSERQQTRRRGKARDDQKVLAEAHKAPARRIAQVFPTGERRDGREVFRTTQFYGCVMVSIVERYRQTHVPVSSDDCKETVFRHSRSGREHKNPFAILAQLERAGDPPLLLVDSAAHRSDRIPRVDDIVLELDDGTVLWPKPESKTSPRRRSDAKETGRSLLSREEFVEALRDEFPDDEFTVRQAIERVPGAGGSTAYDRVRRLASEGTLVQSGGQKGTARDPARYRFPSVSVAEPAALTVGNGAVKSREELQKDLEALQREIRKANEPYQTWNARHVEFGREIEAARNTLDRLLAEQAVHDQMENGIPDTGDLEEKAERVQFLIDHYDLLLK